MAFILPHEIYKILVRIEEIKTYNNFIVLSYMDEKRTLEGEQLILNRAHDYLAEMCCEIRILQKYNFMLNK